MARIIGQIRIAAAVEQVFDTVADSRNEPSFNPAMTGVELLTPPPIGLGARFRAHMGKAGMEMLVELTEFERPHRLGSRTTSSMMETSGTLSFAADGTDAVMSWDWQLRPKGWLRMLGPLSGPLAGRMERRIWTGLKHRLEADASAHPTQPDTFISMVPPDRAIGPVGTRCVHERGTRRSKMSERMLRSGTVKVEASASPEQVWEVLTDVTRVGEWSHECQGAQWLTGEGATVGARFRGRNRAGVMRWSRACTITEVEPTKRLVYRTKGGVFGDATEWTFDLEATAGGCRVVQRYKVLSLPRAVEWMILKMVPRHSDRSAALRADIERLGQVATTEARSDQNRA